MPVIRFMCGYANTQSGERSAKRSGTLFYGESANLDCVVKGGCPESIKDVGKTSKAPQTYRGLDTESVITKQVTEFPPGSASLVKTQ